MNGFCVYKLLPAKDLFIIIVYLFKYLNCFCVYCSGILVLEKTRLQTFVLL